jgi:hypothetical protein
LSKQLTQVRLVGESASARDIAQRSVRLQHVARGQLQATPYYESVRRLTEGMPEGAREVRFAPPNERTEIRDEYRPFDVTIDIVKHLARLPGQ